MIVVSDTSPLTNLLTIGMEDILQYLYKEVILPRAVFDELKQFHPVLPEFLKVETVRNQGAVRALRERIDEGEAEAIILAEELKAEYLLIDEMIGLEVATSRNLRVIGLLDVLVQARRKGRISALKPIIDRLEQSPGFWISDELKAEILSSVNES